MLQIKKICKEYRTGSLVQKALDGVSLNLRDNEFVAILGPSGSGKTTLLNVIGGLDRYDSGDLIINGISTKKYKDRDWDSYRNHTIGFVFQSYNLIPHQTLLANVELALTISGVGKAQRKERAKKALERVGLGEQIHKRPSQLSGGQMQRVAIARALVNDPDILLADEPTGALDSETSIQVMELLKEVAKDRLVVMVTHNPELAQQYATRIVELKDGKIRSDSDAFLADEAGEVLPEHKNMGKASMSFLTALSLSFNNLRTKKARTLLTSFAGSIGIIGIALILSLSAGVNDYIKNIERETLSQYPLQIQSTGFDFTSMMSGGENSEEAKTTSASAGTDASSKSVSSTDVSSKGASSKERQEKENIWVIDMVTNMFSTMDSNDLESLKKYLDSDASRIGEYTNAVEYSYPVVPQIYAKDSHSVRQVHPDRSFEAAGLGSSVGSNSLMSSMMSTDVFYQMPSDPDLYKDQYDVKAGRWPKSYNECVLVLTTGGGMSDLLLYTLGLRDPLELEEMVAGFVEEEQIDIPKDTNLYTYDDILGKEFRLVNSADYYSYDSAYHVWKDRSGDDAYMKELVERAEPIRIVGIVQPSEDANGSALMAGINYPASLTEHVVEQAEKSKIVQEQKADPKVNVLTGEAFGTEKSHEGLGTDSLITINEEKLAQAFAFDKNAFSEAGNAVDFSEVFRAAGSASNLTGMLDLSEISVQLPDMPQMDLEEMLGSLELTVSPDGFLPMAESLTEGYRQYAAAHPEADYSSLAENFSQYLSTSQAQEIIRRNIGEIIQSGEGMAVTAKQLQAMVTEIAKGYGRFIIENGYDDPSKFDEYLNAYLQTEEAKAILNRYAGEILGGLAGNLTITGEQIKKLSAELSEGYLVYAAENGLADPSKMGEHFIAYLQTEDGSQRLSEGMKGIVDTDSLEQQITSAFDKYMKGAVLSYAGAAKTVIEEQIRSAMGQVMNQLGSAMSASMEQAMTQVGNSLQNAMHVDKDAFAEAFQMNMTGEELAELMMSVGAAQSATYENNLRQLGYADFDVPAAISIYPKDFESKEEVVNILDDYNRQMEEDGKEEQVITYTDMVGALMSSVTQIIDIISYVLIAFVAISLIVSSIMIGVITYISVLERKKEIGILRAIGASKGNISQVFNAETFIIGFCAGLIGIGLTLLILIPGNALIHSLAGTNDVSAVLPPIPAVILIILSIILTLLGGLLPAKKAAKSDPVTALRTE